ncbi:MAG TPA: TlpA disulfide reductase family protein [Solirubrobacteraceae bacterium]|nr:TlpA disulfide reductase family protein [Solirubrobacteraceae bacterium]
MKTALIAATVVVLGAALALGLKQAANSNPTTTQTAITASASEVRAKLAGSPPALAALHAQGGQVLGGGQRALKARLARLKGHPAVVNVWASWCGPCNQEAPVLQRVTLDRGRDVAFVGVDLKDSSSGARRFLRRYPNTYPSYADPNGRIYDSYKVVGVPSTVFYDSTGRQQYVHQGPYLTEKDLENDIDRYALGRNVTQAS